MKRRTLDNNTIFAHGFVCASTSILSHGVLNNRLNCITLWRSFGKKCDIDILPRPEGRGFPRHGTVDSVSNDTLPESLHQGGNVIERNNLRLYIFPEPEHLIGHILSLCEVCGMNRDDADTLLERPFFETATTLYTEWRNTLSYRDRRLRLFESAETKSDPLTKHHLERGELRARPDPPTETRKFISRFLKSFNLNKVDPNNCYEECLNCLYWSRSPTQDIEIDTSRIDYYEGLLLQKSASRVASHAWLECDEIPTEITLPWHRTYEPDAVYFGKKVPDQTLTEAFENTPQGEISSLHSPFPMSSKRNYNISRSQLTGSSFWWHEYAVSMRMSVACLQLVP